MKGQSGKGEKKATHPKRGRGVRKVGAGYFSIAS